MFASIKHLLQNFKLDQDLQCAPKHGGNEVECLPIYNMEYITKYIKYLT